MVQFLVHWFVRLGFGYWRKDGRWFVIGLHLFGEVSGPWVAAHYNLEQWAQNQEEKKNEMMTQRQKTIPEFVAAARRSVMMTGEDLNTGTASSESEVEEGPEL